MPRPPAVPTDHIVDATVRAQAGSRIERSFSAADLPRLGEAGALTGSTIDASFQFSEFDGTPAIDGTLTGSAVLTCQRCMKVVAVSVQERFQIVVVQQERADEPGGYEPVIADPSRLDLRWLAEEQVLLALPLVPVHEMNECNDAKVSSSVADADAGPGTNEGTGANEGTRQKPFQNLRDMLRKR